MSNNSVKALNRAGSPLFALFLVLAHLSSRHLPDINEA